MKDANDLMVIALQMYRLLERGVARKDSDGRTAHAPLDLIEKSAVMAIINSLFQAEIQEEQLKRANEQRVVAARAQATVADEYRQ